MSSISVISSHSKFPPSIDARASFSPAQLIFLISEIFIFEGISISDNVPLAVYSFK